MSHAECDVFLSACCCYMIVHIIVRWGGKGKRGQALRATGGWGFQNFYITRSIGQYTCFWSRGSVVGAVTRLLAGRSGVRIPVGAGDFSVSQNLQTGSASHSALYLMGAEVLSRGKSGRGVKLSTHFHLELRLRMSGVIPQLPLYAIMALTGRTLYVIIIIIIIIIFIYCNWVVTRWQWERERERQIDR